MSVYTALLSILLRSVCCALLSSYFFFTTWFSVSLAQVPTHITPDGTLDTRVTQTGRVHTITGGTMRGSNLFHSFARFDVGREDTASFTSMQPGIENILSRVTGGQQSIIDGLLQSTIPGANLFLLNPAGVIFGPNARLDVSGSFHVSTADVLRLTDGKLFNTTPGPQDQLLTTAPPAAFGFLQENPAAIRIQGSHLFVLPGETLSAVGGDIEIAGDDLSLFGFPTLSAPSGQLSLVSVASPGEVVLPVPGESSTLSVESFERLGEVTLSEAARIVANGEGGGGVVIRGSTLTLTEGAQIISTGGNVTIKATESIAFMGSNSMGSPSGVVTLSAGSGDAGHIVIEAPTASLNLEGGAIASFSTSQFGGGTGDIKIEAENLTLKNGGIIGNLSLGSSAGIVEVAVSGTISISGQNPLSGIGSFSLAGDPGELSIRASALHMDGGGIGAPSLVPIFLPTPASGRGGNVTIEVDTLTAKNGAQISSSTTTTGAAGNVTVAAGSLSLADGAQINSSTLGPGHGGRVTVTATEAITLRGTRPDGQFPSGIIARTEGTAAGAGNAGSIRVEAAQVSLSDGAQIDSSTLGPGQGGEVTVRATETITIAGQDSSGSRSGIFSAARGAGPAGNLTITTGELAMADGRIASDTTADGAAGTITLEAERIRLTQGAQISGSSGLIDTAGKVLVGGGAGGDVTITADTLVIQGEDETGVFPSGIFSGTLGAGRAGDLTVTTEQLTLLDGAQLSSSTLEAGVGGTVTVKATEAITIAGRGSEEPQTGLFSVTDGQGNAGGVFVSAPRLTLEGGRILARTLGDGNAGNIEVRVGQLTLTGGAQIFNGIGNAQASGEILGNPEGIGRGGNFTVSATESIVITGRDSVGFPSGLFSSTQIGMGRAGDLLVTAPHLEMREGGGLGVGSGRASRGDAGNLTVEVGTLELTEEAQIDSSTLGPGDGGRVTVIATDLISISSRGSFRTSTEGAGLGGDITLRARRVYLSDNAIIAAESRGTGDAGTIRLTATDTFLSDNSDVTTAAVNANGGDIELESRLVRLTNSVLTAEARGVEQMGSDGGNVMIQAEFVILDHSKIQANAFGGNGGNIVIVAEEAFLADTQTCAEQECLDASSRLGVAGTVAVNTPTADLSGVVTPLPQSFTQAAALLPQRCAERLQGQPVSSFVLAGRDSMPARPGGVLPSPLIVEESSAAQTAANLHGRLHVDEQGWLRMQRWQAQSVSPMALDLACAAWYRRGLSPQQ